MNIGKGEKNVFVVDEVFMYKVKILLEKVAFTLLIEVAPESRPELNTTLEPVGN
jgi:hypothetical protein